MKERYTKKDFYVGQKVYVEYVGLKHSLRGKVGIEIVTKVGNKYIETDHRRKYYIKDGEEGVEKLTSGFIHFASDGEIRSLHYFHHDTLWLDKNSFERNIKQGTPELNNEVTELSLGYNATAVEVMKKIAEFFGGYIQEDDCSGDWFYKVEKIK